jgi:type II secretory pathway component PulF
MGPDGTMSIGSVSASYRGSAVRMLGERGILPLSLEAEGVESVRTRAPRLSGPIHASAVRGRPAISRAELANLVRELATALEAGLPLMQALKTTRRQAAGKALPVILDHLIEGVEAGQPLFQAAKDYGPPFDEMTVGMFRAADATGRMSEIMHQLADLLDRSVELRREVIGATIYPMILAGIMTASIITMVTFVLPKLLAPITSGTKIAIPWPTQVLMSLASFVGTWWWVMLLGATIGWFALRGWLRVPANRMVVDAALLKVPVLGTLLRDVAVARFTRTLGTLVSAGIPILTALRTVRDTLGNYAMMAAIDDVSDRVSTGASLADPLERSGHFPPLLIQIVNIGEKSGKLEPMLMHAAGAFDRQVNNSLKLFTKILPIALLLVMSVVAGFVLVGMLLPLLNMQTALGA